MAKKKYGGSDLSRLGKKSWVKQQLEKPKSSDDNVVTSYSNVPATGIEELKRMVDENPENLDMKDMLAFMLYSNERWDEAIEVFKDLVARNHNPGNQHLYLGNIYYRKGLIQFALIHWDKVREYSPSSMEAKKARERAARVRQGLSINLKES